MASGPHSGCTGPHTIQGDRANIKDVSRRWRKSCRTRAQSRFAGQEFGGGAAAPCGEGPQPESGCLRRCPNGDQPPGSSLSCNHQCGGSARLSVAQGSACRSREVHESGFSGVEHGIPRVGRCRSSPSCARVVRRGEVAEHANERCAMFDTRTPGVDEGIHARPGRKAIREMAFCALLGRHHRRTPADRPGHHTERPDALEQAMQHVRGGAGIGECPMNGCGMSGSTGRASPICSCALRLGAVPRGRAARYQRPSGKPRQIVVSAWP